MHFWEIWKSQEGFSELFTGLSATVWLADIADYGAMNTVWDAWVVPENALLPVAIS